jgi:hypothetical protein
MHIIAELKSTSKTEADKSEAYLPTAGKKWLAEVKTSKQIAFYLCISLNTVETHRRLIVYKLAIHNIAELTNMPFVTN